LTCIYGTSFLILGHKLTCKRLRRIKTGAAVNPTVPQDTFWQIYATTLTIFRELSYPQIFPSVSQWGSTLSWLTPPSLGKALFITVYVITLTTMLCANSILPFSNAYYYESIGFRGAWMSVMQVPLIVLLAGRTNVIGFLVGSSYERINWAHRWVSRGLLCTVAVHAGFFLREWFRADFVAVEIEYMPVVKYGMGAGGLLLWMNVSGLSPLRKAWYEFYVLQHLVSIAVFLWLLHVHVPAYAMYYIWMAIGFVAFDRVVRLVWLLFRNVHLFTRSSGKGRLLGYEVEVYPLPGHVTRVVVRNVSFKWSPGQHIYLSLPRLGLLEAHPFTLSTAYPSDVKPGSPVDATLEIRAHSGLTHRLYTLAKKRSNRLDSNTPSLLAFIQGPLGARPTWNANDSLVLISGSTGASFTMPILESLVDDPGCVRKINMLLISRTAGEAACYLARLRQIVSTVSESSMSIKVCVCVTREFVGDDDSASSLGQNDVEEVDEIKEGDVEKNKVLVQGEELDPKITDLGDRCLCGCDSEGYGCVCGAETQDTDGDNKPSDPSPPSRSLTSTDSTTSIDIEKSTAQLPSKSLPTTTIKPIRAPSTTKSNRQANISLLTTVRPNVAQTIRDLVEGAWGETLVVVCGGRELSGSVRNCVVGLSDERAVHKGTGAQGIMLWVEEFGI
jgi:NAD(P)H-flavin reductase